MKRPIWARLLLFALVVSLLLSAVSAAGGLDNFKAAARSADGFQDVAETAWYAESVQRVCAYGLMQGRSAAKFSPSGNLTVAECTALAARLHSIYMDDGAEFETAKPWYTPYVRYAVETRILSTQMLQTIDYTEKITRALFARILSRALPAEALEAINDIPDGSVPDVKPGDAAYPAIYQLYRAGVMTGSDEVGSAQPGREIKRSEAAAILLRMVEPEQRQTFALKAEFPIYASTGYSKVIQATQYPGYQAKGWKTEPVTTIYCWDGSVSTIKTSKLEQFLTATPNWSTEPFKPMPEELAEQGHTTAGIPVVRVTTEDGAEVVDKENYVNCKVELSNVPESLAKKASAGIRLRGNSSSYYGDVAQIRENPVPYRLKFDEKINLLGMNDGAEAKSWVLLTNLDNERAVIKNDIAFRLGRAILAPDGYYCSDARLVHLYLNDEFWGAYLLCEQNQVNANRVDIHEPEKGYTKTDVGYFVELDMYGDEPSFTVRYADEATVFDIKGVKRSLRPAYYSIKSDIYSAAQKKYIAKYVENVFEILYQACEKDRYFELDRNHDLRKSDAASAQECIAAVADLRSMADMYILYELVCDYDVGQSSFYMCVDFSADSESPKLTFTAPWDFNWTLVGNTEGVFAGAFRSNNFVKNSEDRSNPWFILLCKQDWFQDLVKERWQELGGMDFVQQCVSQEKRLIKVFGDDLNAYTPDVTEKCTIDMDWLLDRAEWLDKQWS